MLYRVAILLLLTIASAQAQSTGGGSSSGGGAVGHPGYIAGRFYTPPLGGITNGATAIPTLDTVVFVVPFLISNYSFNATSINTRVGTGVASCAIKLAIWANNPAIGRPTGTPIAGSNTAQSCATSATTQTTAVSITLSPGLYWIGMAATTGGSTFLSLAAANIWTEAIMGGTAVSASTTIALSAPYTYATDITTLNLTGATYTDVTTAGVPVPFLGD